MAVPVSIVIALSAILPVLCWQYILYPAFFSPLARIPNAHFTSPISPAWILWQRYCGRANAATHAAHVRQGPIVRLGPSELSINCIDDGVRTVYGGNWEKAPWYPNLFHNYNVPNMFSVAENRPHGLRKRLMSHLYSKSYLSTSSVISAISHSLIYDRLLPFLRAPPSLAATAVEANPAPIVARPAGAGAEAGVDVDMYSLANAYTMDAITAFCFGLRCGTDHIRRPADNVRWFRWWTAREEGLFWQAELPGFKAFVNRLGWPLGKVPSALAAGQAMEELTLDMCDAAEAIRQTHKGPEPGDEGSFPVVYAHLMDALETEDPSKGTARLGDNAPIRLEVASEVLDHFAAGFDTSGITVTYLAWQLCRNPQIQDRLRTELLTLEPPISDCIQPNGQKTRELPSVSKLDALPLLNAVVMETLRLHAAIPGPLPRAAPVSTGRTSTTLMGVSGIPAGTRVAAQAYSLHREAAVFPDPESWRPERWLPDTDAIDGISPTEKKERWFWPFASGSRMCIGNHFATHSIKLFAAAVWSNYRTTIVDDRDIEARDFYTAPPCRRRLVLRLEALHQDNHSQ